MDFLITMDDGSEAVLSHHGIKGMKWGKWNAETAARYAGTKNLQAGGGRLSDEDSKDDENEDEKKHAIDELEKKHNLDTEGFTEEQREIAVTNTAVDRARSAILDILGAKPEDNRYSNGVPDAPAEITGPKYGEYYEAPHGNASTTVSDWEEYHEQKRKQNGR